MKRVLTKLLFVAVAQCVFLMSSQIVTVEAANKSEEGKVTADVEFYYSEMSDSSVIDNEKPSSNTGFLPKTGEKEHNNILIMIGILLIVILIYSKRKYWNVGDYNE